MTRNKEGLVLLLDVGPSMYNCVPEVEKLCSLLIQKKLIYNKSNEVGVVVFGTQDTDNELTSEIGGYEHIRVLSNIKVVDGDLIRVLQNLSRGTCDGDFLKLLQMFDAIVVGMDMVIKKYQSTSKGKKRICLITNGICAIKDPIEGSKDEQIVTIASSMAEHGIKMESIIVRGQGYSTADKKIVDENDKLLNIISAKTSAKTVYVGSSTSLLGSLRTRSIMPVTIFRGDLEVAPNLNIKVWVYKKTTEEKFPTLKRYSDKAPSTDRLATHEVKLDYEYKNAEDTSKVIPPEQRIKGYRYGPQVVPISDSVREAVLFKPEKGVKLLGFTDSSSILRHYYMKDTNIFIPEPGNSKAILAVSALARAMNEAHKVAILRCGWKQGQTNVVVGVLTPNVSQKEAIPDSFYFNILPFAEDVREYHFPSFSSYPAAWQPNEQQQEAADNLVKSLDLAPSQFDESLIPDYTPNPVLERFYRYLELKSREKDAVVPPIDETLKKITEPDQELLSPNKHILNTFGKIFEVKENPKLKKSLGRAIREKVSGSDDEDNRIASSKPDAVEITEKDPVLQFEAMMSRRDGDWVHKAISGMTRKILDLLEDSYEGDNFGKAIDCLIALRKGCISEQEPKEFNDFFRRLLSLCEEKYLRSFLFLMSAKNITLISRLEAVDSEVPEEEARQLLVIIKNDSQ